MEEGVMATVAHKEQGVLDYPYGRVSSDEEVLSNVLNALHHNTGIPQDDVRVEVRNGRVVLSGAVSQDFERALAEQTAESAPGVVEVANKITLSS
jgi:osmotically-inducible protein OsmY